MAAESRARTEFKTAARLGAAVILSGLAPRPSTEFYKTTATTNTGISASRISLHGNYKLFAGKTVDRGPRRIPNF